MKTEHIRRLLLSVRTIASVGVSSSPAKESYSIVAYLMNQGYRVFPVNPGVEQILGQKTYPDLLSIPEPVDVVQLFRRSEDVPPFVEQAIQIGAKVVWMQAGIINEEAAQAAEAAGLQVVMDECMRNAHMRLVGRPV
jgi:predicted CoA-binding protein